MGLASAGNGMGLETKPAGRVRCSLPDRVPFPMAVCKTAGCETLGLVAEEFKSLGTHHIGE